MQDWISQHKWIEWVFSGIGLLLIPTILALLRSFLGFVSQRYTLGIAGTWNITIEQSPHSGPHGRMELKQIGPYVWGNAELNVTQNGQANRILKYSYLGIYAKEQSVLRFKENGKDARLIGGSVLKLDTRGDSASGCNAFWDHSDNKRRYQEFKLQRITDA